MPPGPGPGSSMAGGTPMNTGPAMTMASNMPGGPPMSMTGPIPGNRPSMSMSSSPMPNGPPMPMQGGPPMSMSSPIGNHMTSGPPMSSQMSGGPPMSMSGGPPMSMSGPPMSMTSHMPGGPPMSMPGGPPMSMPGGPMQGGPPMSVPGGPPMSMPSGPMPGGPPMMMHGGPGGPMPMPGGGPMPGQDPFYSSPFSTPFYRRPTPYMGQPDYRIYELNKRLQHRTEDSDNLWWDTFTTEFFEDDAQLTLTFCLEDGPKRYTIGRTLIPRYFRSIFEGGVSDLHYVLKYPKESFHNTTITLDCDHALMVTQHGKPMFTNVSMGNFILNFLKVSLDYNFLSKGN
ncbi:LIM domain-binding protein 2 [Plakobranchus ocellatus]|uniref:LIM domain-binding protein 2 n=1 Tax=Plakobranchus ocellatus TaxID=259542 RepID=A0AAV3YEU1_9GAST|nr:LIM domain-binding protein 2 [Plakobranchus ocellatus]